VRGQRRSFRKRALAAVAVAVLVGVGVEVATGVVLYWLRTGVPLVTIGPLTLGVHVYVGLACLPIVAVKLLLTWFRLLSARPETLVARLDRWASWLLVALIAGVNATGLQLQYQPTAAPKWFVAQIHLWLTVALLLPVLWHLQRYLSPTLSWLGARRTGPRAAGASSPRRRLLWAGVTAVAGLAILRLPGGVAGSRPGAARAGSTAVSAPTVGDAAAGSPECTPEDRSTANDFPVTGYRTGGAPIDARAWRLNVVGDVGEPLSLSYDDLLKMPRSRYEYQLECPLSFEVVREWGGVPLMDLLALAKASPDFRFIVVRGDDGYEVTHLRASLERRSVLLCTHVNCEPLAEEHGYPMRLMMPGVDGGRCVKWVHRIDVRIKA
jgi:DMSO/TMAO reductase YedYZ molybdopterin-dependent catalytic subunit